VVLVKALLLICFIVLPFDRDYKVGAVFKSRSVYFVTIDQANSPPQVKTDIFLHRYNSKKIATRIAFGYIVPSLDNN
jgi:hypothetical protein